MAPSRRVPRRQTRTATLIQGGIRRSRRVQQAPARLGEENTATPERRAGSPLPTITLGSELSELSSVTLLSETSDTQAEQEPGTVTQPQPEHLDIPTLNNILQQREDQFLDRILTQLARQQSPPPHHGRAGVPERGRPTQPPTQAPYRSTQHTGDTISEVNSTYSPPPILSHDESASAAMNSVEAWFPGVERATLTQIIENRFKPTNIHRLLASEKERAESQRLINIGGVYFEQGEREGRESEYRMGPFFKAWAAYCGILTKLAPAALQCDLACSLHIYTMTLHELAERYAWEGVKSYHFQFHRKRIASGKEVYYPDDWRKLDPELIASKCFLYPKASASNGWASARGHTGQRGDQGTGIGSITYHRPPMSNNPAAAADSSSNNHPETRITRARQWLPSSSCRNWNYRECRVPQCRYLHACISCGGNHRASHCAGSGAGGGGATSR